MINPEISIDELKKLVRYEPGTGKFIHLIGRKNVRPGDVAGGLDGDGYVRMWIDGKRFKAHRLAVFYMTGKWPEVVDHINGIRSDNRWENIRECTVAINNSNPGMSPRNKSGCQGVHWHSRQQKWIAAIQINRKKIHLGSYDKKDDAERAASIASTVMDAVLKAYVSHQESGN